MKTRLWLRLLVLAGFVALFAGPQPAWACSCMMPPQPPQSFADAAAVFSGRVTGISNPVQLPLVPQILNTWASWTGSPAPYNFYDRQVTFAVSDSWKGVESTTVTVETGQGGADCGYVFSTGQQYVVYAHSFQGAALQTNICTRTAALSNAAADLTYLNTLPRLTLNPASTAVWPYVAGAAVLLAAAAGGVTWLVRKRVADSAASD
jgi:hypothetical protein